MSIQIFTEQSALFVNPGNKYDTFEAKCFEFVTAPDWVVNTLLFKLLQKDGKIKILNAGDKFIENNGVIAKVEPEVTNEPDPAVEEESAANDNEIQNYAEMSNKELYALCMEKGIEAEPKKNKDYYLNLLAKN